MKQHQPLSLKFCPSINYVLMFKYFEPEKIWSEAPKTALPDRGCSHPEVVRAVVCGVQESIVKDKINIFLRRKDYQFRYFFHNWSLPASKSIEQKIMTSRKLHFSRRNVVRMSVFHYCFSLLCFIQIKGVRDCPRQSQGVRRWKRMGKRWPMKRIISL